jgi:hypothetical protein
MPKFIAPDEVDHFEFDNVVYNRGDDGTFEFHHPDHVKAAKRHGCVPYDPDTGPVLPAVERVQSDFDALNAAHEDELADAQKAHDDELAARDRKIAEQDELIRSLSERMAALEGAAAPARPADTSGDTSPGHGGGTDEADPVGAALALSPDFDSMDRDALVAWAEGTFKIDLPGNISKDKARQVVDDGIAAYLTAKE